MTTICLAIPHTPWVEARVQSMQRLRASIFQALDERGNVRAASDVTLTYRELTERAPNDVWSLDMWQWMLETGADFCLTLQDDVIVAPCFWPALRAMLTKLPKGAALGLSAVHPHARELARQGARWYRTRAWIIGWAYGWWREDLARFVEWRLSKDGQDVCEQIKPNGEDTLQNVWISKEGLDVWHPVPTIVDHDVSLESTYGNDEHTHRRPHCTWRAFDERELVSPDFWITTRPKLIRCAPQHLCSFCGERDPLFKAPNTGASICGPCLHMINGDMLRRMGG